MEGVLVMLTLKQFTAMADSYGADLQRWPEDVRGEAEALFSSSHRARMVLSQVRTLDTAIELASVQEESELWNPDDQDAALARLRSNVAARIASSSGSQNTDRLHVSALPKKLHWAALPRLGWLGLVGSGGIAIVAGLMIGIAYSSPSRPDNLLTMLQPTLIQILAD
jgi:hypothetical protein